MSKSKSMFNIEINNKTTIKVIAEHFPQLFFKMQQQQFNPRSFLVTTKPKEGSNHFLSIRTQAHLKSQDLVLLLVCHRLLKEATGYVCFIVYGSDQKLARKEGYYIILCPKIVLEMLVSSMHYFLVPKMCSIMEELQLTWGQILISFESLFSSA